MSLFADSVVGFQYYHITYADLFQYHYFIADRIEALSIAPIGITYQETDQGILPRLRRPDEYYDHWRCENGGRVPKRAIEG